MKSPMPVAGMFRFHPKQARRGSPQPVPRPAAGVRARQFSIRFNVDAEH